MASSIFWLYVPFGLQAIAIFFDEFFFHHKRGLPKWERIGHPLDTLTVVACYAFLALTTPSVLNLEIYIGLCVVSCLFITKDEFVHSEHCEPRENWLHAVLFMLHPVVFLCAGYIWYESLSPFFLKVQPLVLITFTAYQIIYWSYRSSNGKRQQRHL